MKNWLNYFIFGWSLLTTHAVYAENATKPAVYFIPADYPYRLTLARQLVQLDGSAVALKEPDFGLTQLAKGKKLQDDKFLTYVQEYLENHKPIEMLVQIYAQELNIEELTGAIEFYKTPAGQSLAKKVPIITQKYTTQRTNELIQAFEYAQTKLEQEKQNK